MDTYSVMGSSLPRSAFALCLACLLASATARAVETSQLGAEDSGLFGGTAWAVTDDGSVVFGHADVVQGGGNGNQTPVRWIRQPDGSFASDPLGEGATVLDLPRGQAVDASADGTAAALYGLSKWTEAGGIACGAFCPVENENTAITADGVSIVSTSFLSPGPGQRVLLWSDSGIDVVDQITSPAFGQFHAWDVSADGTVVVGEFPGDVDIQPVVWTRNGPNDWTRTLPGLPPGASSARAYRVSDDGRVVLVQPIASGILGVAVLWSAEGGYEDISTPTCQPDALDRDGGIAIGRCDPNLGRWVRGVGWEVFPTVPAFAAKDVSPDGRFAVGGGNYGRWADLGPLSDCENGIDDDGDGLVDFGHDPGCATQSDLSEQDPTHPCDDGIDNDGDGFTDFPNDPACQTPLFPRENAKCQDGIDNDGDGAIDFDGGASRNGGVPIAAPDPVCVDAPWRDSEQPSHCGLGAELPLVLAGLAAWRRRARR